MKITRLQASGIKGTNIDFVPDRVSIITGPNYSGKTAYQIALDLAILGDSPRFGKSNAATFELSDGGPIDVSLDIDGQTVIRRTWEILGHGVTAKKNIGINFPRILLDLSEVLGAKVSKADRLAYLFRMADAGSVLSWEKIAVAIKTAAIETPTEATEKALQQVLELAENAPGETIQDRLQNALGVLADRLKIVNAELRDLTGFANVQTRQADLDAPVANAKAKVEKARKELEELRVKQDQAIRAISEYERIAGLLMDAETYLPYPADSGEDAEIEAEIAGTEKQIAITRDVLGAPEYWDCEERYSQIVEKVQYCSFGKRSRRELIDRLEVDIAKCQRRYNEVEMMDACPTCGADGTDWRAKLVMQSEEELAALCEEKSEHEVAMANYERDYELLCIQRDELGAKVTFVQQTRAEIATLERALHDLQKRLRWLETDRHAAQIADAQRSADIANYRAQLSGMDKAALETEYSHIADVVEFAREILQEADKLLQTETANRSNELEKQKAIMRRDTAQAQQIALKAAGKALQQLQRDAIADSFAPLLQVARKFTDGILRAPLDFHESELGYWHGKKFVKHSTFSGTEESLSYVGLMIALANASNAPVKIAVIDEMGRFDPVVTRPKVMQRMMELTQSGVLDHFIGIDPDARFYDAYNEMGGVKVLDLGGGVG